MWTHTCDPLETAPTYRARAVYPSPHALAGCAVQPCVATHHVSGMMDKVVWMIKSYRTASLVIGEVSKVIICALRPHCKKKLPAGPFGKLMIMMGQYYCMRQKGVVRILFPPPPPAHPWAWRTSLAWC